MRIKTSFDDGCASDLRVSKLLIKYGIKAVFYVPVDWHSLAFAKGYEPLNYYELKYISQNFEIGSHGITHRLLTRIPKEEAEYEIRVSRPIMERIVDKPVEKFAPSRGYLNDELRRYAEDCYSDVRMTVGDNLVHIHPKSGVNNGLPWQERARDMNGRVHLWGHTWELDRFNMWQDFENFIKHVAKQ